MVFWRTGALRMGRGEDENRFLLIGPPPAEIPPAWITPTPDIADAACARGALTKAGTVTLELAVMGVPQVVAHRVHPMTHWLGQRFVHGIRHIAMPNILAGTEVVTAFVQDRSPGLLAATLMGLPDHQAIDLSALGEAGVVGRTADHVGQWLGLP